MVKVQLKQETAASSHKAQVIVFNDQLITNIIDAEIVYQMGADGGMYPVIKFSNTDIISGRFTEMN